VGSGENVELRDLRNEYRGPNRVVLAALTEAHKAGWTIRRQGHKVRVYCPCGRDAVTVAGTPRVPEREARRVRAAVARCPDRHPDE